jgi:hypothetical protein
LWTYIQIPIKRWDGEHTVDGQRKISEEYAKEVSQLGTIALQNLSIKALHTFAFPTAMMMTGDRCQMQMPQIYKGRRILGGLAPQVFWIPLFAG